MRRLVALSSTTRAGMPCSWGRTERGSACRRPGCRSGREMEGASRDPVRFRPRFCRPCVDQWWLIVSPRPVPPNRRVVELSAWANAWKMCSQLVGRDADAGVGTAKCRMALAVDRARLEDSREHDFPVVSEFEGVAEQVDHDLTQARRISHKEFRDARR